METEVRGSCRNLEEAKIRLNGAQDFNLSSILERELWPPPLHTTFSLNYAIHVETEGSPRNLTEDEGSYNYDRQQS